VAAAAPPPDRPPKEALVLSGGGAKGAFEVGVMKALFAGASPATGFQPLDVEIYTGSSVGAFNAAFLDSRPGLPAAAAVAELEQIWFRRIADSLGSCGNGVFRLRVPPLLEPGCWLSPAESLANAARDALFWARYGVARGAQFATATAPLKTRIFDTFDLSALFSRQPFEALLAEIIDFEGLRRSGRELTVLAANWRVGTVREFTAADIADRFGNLVILASTAIPGLFLPEVIEGEPYVDGGVLMTTPLLPAIRQGADVLHVVYLDPLLQDIPFPALPDTLDTLYRLYVILVAQNFTLDFRAAAAINGELELLERLGLTEEALAAGGGGELAGFSRVVARLRAGGRPYRRLTVHRYRPQTDLGGSQGLLDFGLRTLEGLVAAGYEEAVHHDCRQAECILPGEPVVPAAAPGGAP